MVRCAGCDHHRVHARHGHLRVGWPLLLCRSVGRLLPHPLLRRPVQGRRGTPTCIKFQKPTMPLHLLFIIFIPQRHSLFSTHPRAGTPFSLLSAPLPFVPPACRQALRTLSKRHFFRVHLTPPTHTRRWEESAEQKKPSLHSLPVAACFFLLLCSLCIYYSSSYEHHHYPPPPPLLCYSFFRSWVARAMQRVAH